MRRSRDACRRHGQRADAAFAAAVDFALPSRQLR